MSDQILLTRREFTLDWVLAVLAGATITITGCGGDDDNSNPGTSHRRSRAIRQESSARTMVTPPL